MKNKNLHMWALMIASGNVYQFDCWRDVFDLHAVFETRKAAREYANLFKKSHPREFVKVIQCMKGD